MHLTSNSITVDQAVEHLFLAPVESPGIIPTILPLVVGALVIELYFGKHPDEKLGWNTSVGNAVIWAATGLSLLMTETPTGLERQAIYGLIGLGGLVGYMNFYHRWPPAIAYLVSSSGIVYSLAYALVVAVKTDLVFNQTVFKGLIVFVIAVNLLFKLIQGFETPTRDDQMLRSDL